MMQLAKKIPFEDPNVLNACRGMYIFSNTIIMGIYYYVYTQIQKKKGEREHARASALIPSISPFFHASTRPSPTNPPNLHVSDYPTPNLQT